MTRTAVASIVALLLGFLAGRWTTPPAPVAVVAAPAPVAAPEAPATQPDCQRQLALAMSVLDATERDRMGAPRPFPPDLPPAMRPENFEQAVREGLAACPDVEAELARVECSEFPCLAFLAQEVDMEYDAMTDLVECDGWTERFGRWAGKDVQEFVTADGPVEYGVLLPVPVGTKHDENAQKRSELRIADVRADLMAETGGREPTELEKLDLRIAALRAEGDDERFAELLEALEKQRAELTGAGE